MTKQRPAQVYPLITLPTICNDVLEDFVQKIAPEATIIYVFTGVDGPFSWGKVLSRVFYTHLKAHADSEINLLLYHEGPYELQRNLSGGTAFPTYQRLLAISELLRSRRKQVTVRIISGRRYEKCELDFGQKLEGLEAFVLTASVGLTIESGGVIRRLYLPTSLQETSLRGKLAASFMRMWTDEYSETCF